MDDTFSAEMLQAQLRDIPGPLVIDVRGDAAYAAAREAVPRAIRRDPDRVADWALELEIGRRIVAYCEDGRASSRAAEALRDRGLPAAHLDGGIAGWTAHGFPTAAKPVVPTLWVTRERPKVDRIACPWLIRRFIDPDARFLYVPAAQVQVVAGQTGAIPFDVPEVKFGHAGVQCSFDAFIRHYQLHDPALDRLAEIVRGADTGHPDLTAQSSGLLALSGGLSAIFDDDQRQLRHGLVLYDALYAWCRTQTATKASVV
ncbi:MAG: chromate resistance protein [Alphaproteobacteria bacterium]|nr:chromate resistance protein [Alphaproteobacteria bacterium]